MPSLDATTALNLDYRALTRRVLGLYKGARRQTRFHIWARSRSLDMGVLLEKLPPDGRLFDLGCGHGLFGLLAWFRHPGLEVVGRDLSEGKVGVARAATPEGAPITFTVGSDIPDTPASCSAVTVLDVLSYIPFEEWTDLFASIHRCLRPGGVLLLKTHDPARRLKFLWNNLHESLTVRRNHVFGLENVTFRPRAWFVEALGAAGFDVEVERMDRGTPYSHVLFVARKR